MYNQIKNWASFLLILTFLLVSAKSKATHVLGSELSYEHIDGDTFLIKLKVYRDCHGIDVSSTPFTVTPKGKSSISITGTLYGGADVTPVCKSAVTSCQDPSKFHHAPGIEEYFIDALVVLPDCEYTISWEQCCRSADITTGAAGQNYYTEVTLNKCVAGITSSPIFITRPFILGCIDQCTTVLQSAVGNAGDSLVYMLAEPLGGKNTPIPYSTGYSNDAPFKYQSYPNKDSAYNFPVCNGIHINTQTGELNFKATDTDMTVMVIVVEQWRKDNSGIYQKVSTIRKDALLFLVKCPPNQQPLISGIDSTNATEIHICAKDTSTFTIYTKDDSKDTVEVKLTGNIPGNALTLTKTQQQNGKFKWSPEEKHVRVLPYWFVVRAEDNACPVPAYLEKSFKVYVHSALTNINIKSKKAQCEDNYTFSSGLTTKTGLKFEWRINDSIVSTDTALTYNFVGTGKYIVSLKIDNGNCIKRITDSVFVKEKPSINKNIVRTICRGDTIKLTARNADTYTWKPALFVSSGTGTSTNIFPNKTTTFYLYGKDTVTGCINQDSITIYVDTTCVWPGDANLDKTADYLDILDIALGYSTVGTPRINASTDWKPQQSKDWINTLSTGINYKYLDTNGDSVIDADDTFAVAKNYGKTHLKNEEPQLAGNPNDPPLYFQYNKQYYFAGDTVKATLYLGSTDKPVKDVYGLGLKHFFANPYMQPNSYKFNWDCDMLCGAKDNFQLYRQFNDKATGEGAIIRTDKLTTSNPFGKVAEIEFTLKDSTFNYPKAGVNISMQILKSKLIDMSGNEILVYTKADSVKVYRTKNDVVGVKENSKLLNADIKIYPNPANNLVYIQSNKEAFTEIAVVNLLGETVLSSLQNTNTTTLNIQNLPSGIYFVKIRMKNKYIQQKLIITK